MNVLTVYQKLNTGHHEIKDLFPCSPAEVRNILIKIYEKLPNKSPFLVKMIDFLDES